MKKLLLMVAFMIAALLAKSQSVTQGGYTGTYKWNDAVLMQYCDASGTITANIDAVYAITGSKFTVYNVVKDGVVIKMYDYTVLTTTGINTNNGNSLRTSNNEKIFHIKDLFFKYNFKGDPKDYENLQAVDANTRVYGQHQIYFLVPMNVFTQKAQKITKIAGSLALGAINYPFKFRIGNGKTDFSGAFNLGAALGYKLPHDSLSRWTCTLPIAVSITSVNIDSVSATRNQAGLRTTNNFSALSLAVGTIFENNKIQLGIFVGFDKLSRLTNLQYGWVYQNRPWISIGFGYSLFSEEKPSTSASDAGAQQ